MRYLALTIFLFTVFATASFAQRNENTTDLTAMIAASLKEIQTIKPGMTRAQLLKVFTTEGGLSTGLLRTYVFAKCPYIKVDVEFDAVGRPSRDKLARVPLVEDGRDSIKSISKPYLEWSHVD
jgi:hypothetical protein